MSYFRCPRLASGRVIALFVLMAPAAVLAANFNPPAATADGDPGSLREAILIANGNSQDDVITLEAGTYALNIGNSAGQENAALEGDLDLTESGFSITIQGAGTASTFIDQLVLDRVFHVFSGVIVELRDLTVMHGTAVDNGGSGDMPGSGGRGGAILNAGGDLKLATTILDLNIAQGSLATEGGGAIYQSSGSLNLTNSVNGETRLTNNAVSGNDGAGGALFLAGGSVISNNMRMTGNEAAGNGGAVEISAGTANFNGNTRMLNNQALGAASGGNGGALHVNGAATVSILNSIVNNNHASKAGGGLWNSATGSLTVKSTSVGGNVAEGAGGGGIYNDGGTLLLDSDPGPVNVSGNQATGISGLGRGGGVLSVGGSVTLQGVGNQVGNLSNNTAAGRGGGIAMTGAGSTLTITNARVQSNLGNQFGGGLYLADVTTSLIDAEIINNDVSGSGGGVFQDSGTLTMDGDSLISGNDALAGPGGGFYLNANTTTTISGTVSNNTSTSSGGGIMHDGNTLTIDGGTISGNGALATGGGIRVGDNRVASVINGSLIDGNMAGAQGGGICISDIGGTLTVADSTISGNVADFNNDNDGNGGGINNLGAGAVNITNTTIAGNMAVDGGGIYNDDEGGSSGNLTLATVAVSNNMAKRSGGGLFQRSAVGTVTLTDVNFDGNTANGMAATNGGGGIYNDGFALNLGGSVSVTNNAATAGSGSGGGIFNNTGGTLTVTGATVTGNTANRAGGGIEDRSGVGLGISLTNVTLSFNKALTGPGNGGGLHVTGAGDVSLSGGTVSGNTASSEGGGLWNGSGTMTLAGVTIDGNNASGAAADNGGGGVFNSGGVVNIQSGTTIGGNLADGTAGSGGGIFNDAGGTLTISDSTITGNSANRAGGGIEDNSGAGLGVVLNSVALQSNAALSNPGSGGGLHVTGAGDVLISASTISTNNAAASGGGLWNGSGTMTVVDTNVTDNVAAGPAATDGGGAIFNNGGTLLLSGTTFIGSNNANGAAANGGGAFVNGGSLQANGIAISNNTSQGVYAAAGAVVSLTNVGSSNIGQGLETDGAASVYLNAGLYSGILIRSTGSMITDGDVNATSPIDVETTGSIDVQTGGWFGPTNVILAPGTTATFAAGTSSGYVGTTLLSSGTTIIDGTLDSSGGTVTVGSGAVLGGSGFINRAVDVDGVIDPGPIGVSPADTGLLQVESVAFGDGSQLRVQLNSTVPVTGYDQLRVVNGSVSIDAGSMLTGGATTTFADGTSLVVLEQATMGAIIGNFGNAVPPSPPASIALGSDDFDFDYLGGDGNDFVLTPSLVTDLSISKDDGVSEATPGESVVYTIVAANIGAYGTTSNTVTDSFPPACSNVSWSCDDAGGGTCSGSGTGDINDSIDLPAGTHVTYTATCDIDPGASGNLANTASVSVGDGALDTNAGNDEASDVDTLVPTANVGISKDDGVVIAAPEDVLTYTITVSNSGPSAAVGVNVVDTLPPDLGNASWSCEAVLPGPVTACGNASGSGGIDELVDIAPGDSVLFELMATVDAGFAESQIVNTASATVSMGTVDPELGNNSDSDITSSSGVFVDGFEDTVMPLAMGKRSARIEASELAARLPLDTGLKPVLVAKGSDWLRAEQVVVHARRSGGRIEFRLDHRVAGQWTIGRWLPVGGTSVDLSW